jgi:hypothetical protein
MSSEFSKTCEFVENEGEFQVVNRIKIGKKTMFRKQRIVSPVLTPKLDSAVMI